MRGSVEEEERREGAETGKRASRLLKRGSNFDEEGRGAADYPIVGLTTKKNNTNSFFLSFSLKKRKKPSSFSLPGLASQLPKQPCSGPSQGWVSSLATTEPEKTPAAAARQQVKLLETL